MNALTGSTVTKTDVLPEIADHVLVRCIGKGAYGEVWLAKNVMGGYHAVKVIYKRTFIDERPYQREFEGICKFEPISRTHPGLVTVLHVGQNAAGYFYYVMELADDARTGQEIDTETYTPKTLAQVMKTERRLPLEKSFKIGLSLASALAHLHAQKLIHRDIKPSNIIFVHGEPKLADIGLITEEGQDVSKVGSLNYMPPEGPGDAAGDVFSMGKVFYGLFMGMPCERYPELPGEAEEFTTVPALMQVNNLIVKACHYDPRQRFQTARELYAALHDVAKTVVAERPGVGSRMVGDPGAGKPRVETGGHFESGATAGKENRILEEMPDGDEKQLAKARWTRVAVLLLLAIAGGVFFAVTQRPSIIGGHTPSVVAMDTTAEMGIYDPDNKAIGRSNAEEIQKAMQEIMPQSLHPVSLAAGWDSEERVITLHPDLVIIHRSSFFHSYNAVFQFGSTNEFARPADDPKWRFLYNLIGDDKLISLIGTLGNAMPRTKFLIYSRGTDTNWLKDDFRADWVASKVERRFKNLKGRVFTMVIPNGYNGSFRQSETRKLLQTIVIKILGLPERREDKEGK